MNRSVSRRRVAFTGFIRLFLSVIFVTFLPLFGLSSAFSDQITYQSVQAFPFFDAFSTDRGWTGYETGGWERKPAQGGGGAVAGNPDPTTDYTGDGYVLGFNIGGDYPTNLIEKSVISPPIDCSGAEKVFLKFRRWLNVESNKSDFAAIDVSTDGSTWKPVWENPGYDLTDSEWTLVAYDISEIAAHQPTVYIKFTMGPTNSTRTFSGWNIDDLEVTSESIYPVEGTIGTEITIRGTGFGEKKGKVLIQREVLNEKTSKVKKTKLSLKILKGGWADTVIRGTISKALPAGVYDVIIQPKKVAAIEHKASFSVMRPEIEAIHPRTGKYPDEVIVKGKYFGNMAGMVYIVYVKYGEWIWSCGIRKNSWQMNPVTGESSVTFIVPCGLPEGIPFDLAIGNRIGWYVDFEGFTISEFVLGSSCPPRLPAPCPPVCIW